MNVKTILNSDAYNIVVIKSSLDDTTRET